MASNAPRNRSRNGTRATTFTGRSVRTSRTATGGVRVSGAGLGGRTQTVSRGTARALGVTRGTPITRTAAGTKANRPTGRGPATRGRSATAAKGGKAARSGGG